MPTENDNQGTPPILEQPAQPPIKTSENNAEVIIPEVVALEVPVNVPVKSNEDIVLSDRQAEKKRLLIRALAENNGHRKKTARQLGITTKTIRRQIKEFDIKGIPNELFHKYSDTTLRDVQHKPKSLYYNDDDYFKAVEESGKEAVQVLDLENEAVLVRAQIIELARKCRDGSAVGGFDKKGNALDVTDIQKALTIEKLARAIAVIRKTDHDMLLNTVITLANHRIWIAKLAAEIKKEFPDVADQKKFIAASRKAGEPTYGGVQ